jgi:hypothetical protein
MKKFSWLFFMTLIGISCQVNDEIAPSGAIDAKTKASSVSDACGEVQSVTLWAGQTIDAGTLEVYNTEESLFVVYNSANGWLITETHLYVGLNPPKNNKGIIVPGQFPYKGEHDFVTSVTYEIPLSELGDCFDVYAHAVVKKRNDAGEVTAEQTAFGGDTPGTGPRWFFYTNYCVQDCEEECVPQAEAAWADEEGGGTWELLVEYAPNGGIGGEMSTTLYAGGNQVAGTVTFSSVWYDPRSSIGYVDITIELNDCFAFAQSEDNIRIQGYTNPDGSFEFEDIATATENPTTIRVEFKAYYGVYVDVFGGCCE